MVCLVAVCQCVAMIAVGVCAPVYAVLDSLHCAPVCLRLHQSVTPMPALVLHSHGVLAPPPPRELHQIA